MLLILDEMEGYTKRILSPVIPQFEYCGINVLFNHCLIDTSIDTLLPVTRLSSLDNAPIQPNCAYFICKLQSNRERIPKYISYLIDNPAYSYSIQLPLNKYSHCKDWITPWDTKINKSLIFQDKGTGEVVGWYNKEFNILWMGDLGNYPDNALENIRVIMDALVKYKRTGKVSPIKITIGADPEFELLDKKGELISADSLFADERKDKQIGTDGHSATGELRPTYAANPLKLHRNIKRLVRKLNSNPNLSSKVSVCAGGGTKVSTGGHLHFGITNMPEDLKEALWKWVATPVLKHQGKLRSGDTSKCRKGGGDIVRQQPWGVEWRPLPSFIINEDITQAVVTTAYAIVKSYFNGGLPSATSINNCLTRLPLYGIYQNYIDKFISIFLFSEEAPTLLENRDILREWKLSKLNKNPSIIVTSSNQSLEKFFTPLYVRLKEPMRVRIGFGGSNYFETIKVPPKASAKFRKLAERHFVPYVMDGKFAGAGSPSPPRGGDIDIRDGLDEMDPPSTAVAGRRSGGNNYDFEIFLPYPWTPNSKFDATKEIFQEIKDIVKEAIIEFDNNR